MNYRDLELLYQPNGCPIHRRPPPSTAALGVSCHVRTPGGIQLLRGDPQYLGQVGQGAQSPALLREDVSGGGGGGGTGATPTRVRGQDGALFQVLRRMQHPLLEKPMAERRLNPWDAPGGGGTPLPSRDAGAGSIERAAAWGSNGADARPSDWSPATGAMSDRSWLAVYVRPASCLEVAESASGGVSPEPSNDAARASIRSCQASKALFFSASFTAAASCASMSTPSTMFWA